MKVFKASTVMFVLVMGWLLSYQLRCSSGALRCVLSFESIRGGTLRWTRGIKHGVLFFSCAGSCCVTGYHHSPSILTDGAYLSLNGYKIDEVLKIGLHDDDHLDCQAFRSPYNKGTPWVWV